MQLLSLPEAAERLGLTHATLRWQVRNGALNAEMVAGRWLVTETEVMRYEEENKGKHGNRKPREGDPENRQG